MKNEKTLMFKLTRGVTTAILTSFLILAACSDDPTATNEEEVITTITVTLTHATDVVTLGWDDANLDAVVDASEITISGPLKSSTAYTATIEMLNKSVDPVINITEEIEDEANDHIFCFTATGVNIAFSGFDTDSHSRPVGLTSTWTTPTPGSGTVNITLRHQPGVKTGDCPGAGDTDANITFDVSVVGSTE